MTNAEINQFIDKNNSEDIIEYSNRLLDKLNDLTKRTIQVTVYLILLIFIYYISIQSSIKEFEIGPFKISDLSLIRKVTPACVAYLLLEFAVMGRHRAMILKTLRLIMFRRYNIQLTEFDYNPANYNEILRMMFPMSFSIELQHITKMDKKFGCMNMLIQLPLAGIYLIPTFFLIVIIYDSIFKYPSDFLSITCVVIAIYAVIYMIYFYVVILKNAIKENKVDGI